MLCFVQVFQQVFSHVGCAQNGVWEASSEPKPNHSLNFKGCFLWNNLLIFSTEAVLGIFVLYKRKA